MSKLQEYTDTLTNFNSVQEATDWISSIAYTSSITDGASLRIKQNHVRGCCPNCMVWVDGILENNTYTYRLDSDNDIIKGLCRILMDVYNGLSKEQVSEIKFKDFGAISKVLKSDKQKSLQALINRIHKIAEV